MLPKRSVTIKDAAAYGLILTQGYGTFGALQVSTPSMIRFGQMTEDELFVTADGGAGGRAHREPQRDRSARDPEALRSGQSGRRAVAIAEVERQEVGLMTDAIARTDIQRSTTPCGPASSARAARTPSRRSISTRCST